MHKLSNTEGRLPHLQKLEHRSGKLSIVSHVIDYVHSAADLNAITHYLDVRVSKISCTASRTHAELHKMKNDCVHNAVITQQLSQVDCIALLPILPMYA